MPRMPGVSGVGRRGQGQDGAVLVLTAVALVALLAATSLSVDYGRLTVNKRSLQAVADAAATDARFALGTGTVVADSLKLAQDSATRNGFDWSAAGNSLSLTLGTSVAINNVQTFCPMVPATLPAGCPTPQITDPTQANADQVTVAGTIPLLFSGGTGHASATGTWMSLPSTGLSGVRVGSYLAAVDPSNGTLLGGLLGGLLGDSSIQAVGYNGLASGDVTLGQLAVALGVGSPQAALTTSITYPQLIAATISALSANGSDPGATAALTVLNTLNGQLNGSFPANIQLGQLLDLATPGAASAASAYLNVLDIVTGGAEIANGQHFLSVPSLTVNPLASQPLLAPALGALGLRNPQVGPITTSIAAIQPPVTAYGPVGTQASTAQVVITTETVVSAQVSILGIIGLATVNLDVPLTIEAASATGKLTSISCSSPNFPVTIQTNASTATAALGKATGISNGIPALGPAQIVNLSAALGLLTAGVSGQPSAGLAQPAPQSLSFTGAFTNGERGPQSLSQPSLSPSVDLSTLQGTGDIGGLLTPVLGLLDSAVNLLTTDMFNQMLPALGQLGVQVGGADTYNLAYPGSTGVAGCGGAGGTLF